MRELSAEARLHLYERALNKRTGSGFHTAALYGALATTIVTLGWFFFAGRAMVLGMAVDAAVFERFGSVSRFVFRLPIVRLLPRRFRWVRRFFDLSDDPADRDVDP